jgi:hypothetical protein
MTRLTQYAADEAISAQALLAMALKRIQRAERLRGDRVVAMDEVRAARSLLALAREKIDLLGDLISDETRPAAHA